MYPTCATICLCFSIISYYFINMNNNLWIKSVDMFLFEHFELYQVYPCSHYFLLEENLHLRRLYTLKQTTFVPMCCRTDIKISLGYPKNRRLLDLASSLSDIVRFL